MMQVRQPLVEFNRSSLISVHRSIWRNAKFLHLDMHDLELSSDS